MLGNDKLQVLIVSTGLVAGVAWLIRLGAARASERIRYTRLFAFWFAIAGFAVCGWFDLLTTGRMRAGLVLIGLILGMVCGDLVGIVAWQKRQHAEGEE
jgi:xanthine/uracil permease